MSRAIDLPAKERFITVRFLYGNPQQQVRYTDLLQNIELTEGIFVSTPTLEVKFPKNTGTFENEVAKIAVPNDAFTDAVAYGISFAPIFVEIKEFTRPIQGAPSSTALFPFRGRITRSYRGFQGRLDKILFEALPIKARMDFPVSLPANHHCVFTLFGPGCQLAPIVRTGQVSVIDGKVVTIINVSGTNPGKFFQRGYVGFQGNRISIHDWDASDPTKFILRKQPPLSWLSQVVSVVPGCDKTIETCRARYNNEQHFGGFGFAVPAYHPVYEDH